MIYTPDRELDPPSEWWESVTPTKRKCDCCLDDTEISELRTVTTPFKGSFITEEYCPSCVEHLRNQLK